MTELTEKVLRCKKTGEGCSELVQELCLILYRYPRTKEQWSEDECSDFFCSILGKIPGLIERFEFTGAPFDSFLYSTIKWQMKTFSRKRRKHSAYYRVISAPSFWSTVDLHEPFHVYDGEDIPRAILREFHIDHTGVIRDRASCVRVLCMMLRNCEFVDAGLILRVSRLCGCTPEWLTACIAHLRERLENRRELLKKLQARRNAVFMRICLLHDELNLDLDGYRSEKILADIEVEKRHLRALTRRINRFPLFPTHREIGEVLGLPKGTVDSGLYHLKHSMKDFINKKKSGMLDSVKH